MRQNLEQMIPEAGISKSMDGRTAMQILRRIAHRRNHEARAQLFSREEIDAMISAATRHAADMERAAWKEIVRKDRAHVPVKGRRVVPNIRWNEAAVHAIGVRAHRRAASDMSKAIQAGIENPKSVVAKQAALSIQQAQPDPYYGMTIRDSRYLIKRYQQVRNEIAAVRDEYKRMVTAFGRAQSKKAQTAFVKAMSNVAQAEKKAAQESAFYHMERFERAGAMTCAGVRHNVMEAVTLFHMAGIADWKRSERDYVKAWIEKSAQAAYAKGEEQARGTLKTMGDGYHTLESIVAITNKARAHAFAAGTLSSAKEKEIDRESREAAARAVPARLSIMGTAPRFFDMNAAQFDGEEAGIRALHAFAKDARGNKIADIEAEICAAHRKGVAAFLAQTDIENMSAAQDASLEARMARTGPPEVQNRLYAAMTDAAIGKGAIVTDITKAPSARKARENAEKKGESSKPGANQVYAL